MDGKQNSPKNKIVVDLSEPSSCWFDGIPSISKHPNAPDTSYGIAPHLLITIKLLFTVGLGLGREFGCHMRTDPVPNSSNGPTINHPPETNSNGFTEKSPPLSAIWRKIEYGSASSLHFPLLEYFLFLFNFVSIRLVGVSS